MENEPPDIMKSQYNHFCDMSKRKKSGRSPFTVSGHVQRKGHSSIGSEQCFNGMPKPFGLLLHSVEGFCVKHRFPFKWLK